MPRPVLTPGPSNKRQKLQKEDDGQFILCNGECNEAMSLSDIQWEKFKNAVDEWKGLDNMGVFMTPLTWVIE